MADPNARDSSTTTIDEHRLPIDEGTRLRLLVENVYDCAIFLLDSSGKVATWNTGAERLKGYRRDEILGKHFSAFYPEDAVRSGQCERELEGAVRDGRFESEGWHVRRDGTRFWASSVVTVLRDSEGQLVGFARVTRDLTERRRAEDERVRLARLEEANRMKDAYLIREREARQVAEEARSSLATTLKSIGDGVITTDRKGNVTLMNPVAERLTGWTENEARSHPARVVFHVINERSRSVVESPIDRALREKTVTGLANQSVLIARDGRETPVRDSAGPIRDESGNVLGAVLVFRDASDEDRKNARRTVLAEATGVLTSSLDYRETLTRVADFVVPRIADWCVIDVVEDQVPVQVALAHADYLKIEYLRELGKRFRPDPDASQGSPHVIRTGRSEFYPDVTDDILVTTAKSDEHVRVLRELHVRSSIVVPLPGARGVIGALTLVYAESGRRYEAEDLAFAEELGRRAAIAIENARLYSAEQTARELADAASRMKDEFLSTVSHELRTPLSAILGWATILSRPNLDERKRERAIETIERSGRAMARLIEDLLDVSRIVSGKMRLDAGIVDLPSVIEDAIEAVGPVAEAKAISIGTDIGGMVGNVHGDVARLKQVVLNLLSNAVKFTPPGGRVDVHLRRHQAEAEIVVRDTGRGIDPDFLPHLFEPFRQAESSMTRSAGGLGLGLAIVRRLVELHGGHVDAESEGPNRGATFRVRLPLRQHGAPKPDPPEIPRDRTPLLERLHVLVVDDDVETLELLRDVLENCGCRVSTAASAAEAMAAFEREVPDVLISDISMPGESGLDLIRRVRTLPHDKGGRVPAAALTAYARAEDRRRALAAGYELHIPKPVDQMELCAVVGTLSRFSTRR